MKKKNNDKEIEAMKKIARVLMENNNLLSRLDYYLLGGISIDEALPFIYELLSIAKITNDEYEILNNYIKLQKRILVCKNKTILLSTKYVFGNKVITDLQKEVVWCELVNAGIKEKDIDDIVFFAAVMAYAIRNGYVKIENKNVSKTKTLKK